VGGAAPPLSYMTLWPALGQTDLHVCFISLLRQRSGKTLHI